MAMSEPVRPPQPGDELPPFARSTGFDAWNRFAAVSGLFAEIHMDDEVGQSAGYPGAIGIGALQVAYFHNLVRSWAPNGRVLELECRFHAANLKNTVVTARATVTAVAGSRVELELRAEDDLGQTLSTGTAVVAFDSDQAESRNAGANAGR